MGRISPGRGGSDGNTANEDSPSSRNMRPLPVNDRQHHHQDSPVVPDNFEEHCDWVPVSRRNRRPRRNSLPLPENNDGQHISTTSTGNSFSSLQLPSGQHQRHVPRNSQVSNHDLQFHNGIIPRNSVVGNENHRRRTRRRRRPREHVGVLILASEDSQVIQLPVVVFHADDPTAQRHHSSDQSTTHFHDYNDNRRGRYRRSHHHSSSDEHQYIIHQDSHIHLSMDDGFGNIMDDHQAKVSPKVTNTPPAVCGFLVEERFFQSKFLS